LAVEADFMPNEDDIIPAFHDPPMLRIVLIREYLSGEEIPEWMRGKSDEIQGRFKDRVKEEMADKGGFTSCALVA